MANPKPDPRVLVLFDGPLVGYFDQPNKTYQVGVLPAPDHQFSIKILEFQNEVNPFAPPPPAPAPENRVLITSRQLTITDIPKVDWKWTFDVFNQPGKPAPSGADGFDSGTKPIRTNYPLNRQEEMDHRWPICLDDKTDFPEHGVLTKQSGVLNPVIFFRNGLFYTKQVTPRAETVFRKKIGAALEILGCMSEVFAANIEDIEDDGSIRLTTDDNEDIFNLKLKADRSFIIYFQNSLPDEQESQKRPGVPSHFHLSYLALTPSGKRYDLMTVPTRFSDFYAQPYSSQTRVTRGAPAPFRCGIGLVSQPLLP